TLTRLHQLPADPAHAPVGRGRIGLCPADLVAILLAQADHLSGQGPADREVDAVLAVDEMAEQLAHGAAVAANGGLQVFFRYGVDDPQGLFTLPLEGLQ